jgi:hypothetical protein
MAGQPPFGGAWESTCKSGGTGVRMKPESMIGRDAGSLPATSTR